MNTLTLLSKQGANDAATQFEKLLAQNPSLQEVNRQFEALMTHVESWLTRSPAMQTSNPQEAARITLLLRRFRDFFSDYYLYFVRRLLNGDLAGRQAAPVALRRAIGQIIEQGATLNRLLNQRRYGSMYRERLLQADARAERYYNRYEGAKIGGNAPLVYFEKLYHITRFPFRPPPLIAIPLADWNHPPAWLPLAHELGHYVFWNSTELSTFGRTQKKLVDAVKQQCQQFFADHPDLSAAEKTTTRRWLGWLEETFADIFGTLVGGPAYAASAQERQVRHTLARADDLLLDDGEHPMPAIRPLIAIETLRHMPGGSAAADLLAQRWQPYLQQANTAFGKVKPPPDVPPQDIESLLSPAQLAKMVPDMVHKILQTPAFQTADTSSTLNSIQNLTQPWQPDPALDEVGYSTFITRLKGTPPFPPLPSGEPPIGMHAVAASDETYHSDGFNQLLGYIRGEITPKRENQPVWETLLNLDLAPVSESEHTGCLSHWHFLRHKHDYFNRIRCC